MNKDDMSINEVSLLEVIQNAGFGLILDAEATECPECGGKLKVVAQDVECVECGLYATTEGN